MKTTVLAIECPSCFGKGDRNTSATWICPVCKGAGWIPRRNGRIKSSALDYNIPEIYEATVKDKHDSPLAILDNDRSNRIEVYVLNRRAIFSTVVGKEDGQKPFDVMTNRLTFINKTSMADLLKQEIESRGVDEIKKDFEEIEKLFPADGSPINDKGESAEEVLDRFVAWSFHWKTNPVRLEACVIQAMNEWRDIGAQQYAQKVKAVIEGEIDRNKGTKSYNERVEVYSYLANILTQLNNIK